MFFGTPCLSISKLERRRNYSVPLNYQQNYIYLKKDLLDAKEIENNVQKGIGGEYRVKRIEKKTFIFYFPFDSFFRLKTRIKAIKGVKSRQHCQFDLAV